MDVFDLFAKLSLDSSEYESGLQDAETKGSGFGKGLATAAGVGAAAVAAVGTAAIAAGTSLVKGTGDVAAYGDNIDKMSQKMGISAEAYQEWDAIMQHSGTSIDALKPSMKTLATQAEKGSDAFQKLGISEEEVANLSQEDLFAKVITGLQGMEEGTERTYITSQLLGRGATELGALLNTSAEETQKMRDRVHELGGVMSDDAVKASAQFQDTLQDMSTGFDSLKRNMLSEFLPAITGVMDGLTNLFTGNYDEGIEKISEGVTQAIDKLSEMLPKILEVGKNILLALGDAIIQNLPVIMPALADLVMGIGQSIIDNLPMIVDTGLQVILQLANSISQALPTLIPTIVDVVLQIVNTLVDNVDLMVDASIALITGLAVGLINAVPILLEKAPEIVIKLVMAIVENAPKLLEAAISLITQLAGGIVQSIPLAINAIGELLTGLKNAVFEWFSQARQWGIDLIKNFIEGIKSKIGDLKNAVGNVASGVKKMIGFSEPEEGPLSNFHTYAPDMMDLFASGIKSNAKNVFGAVDDVADGIYDSFQTAPALEIAGGYGTMNALVYFTYTSVLVHPPPGCNKCTAKDYIQEWRPIMQGILFDNVSIPFPNSWVENTEKLKNTFTTEAGTEIDLIIRSKKLSVSFATTCLDDELKTYFQFRDKDSFVLTKYDPLTKASTTATVRITDFNYELVRKSSSLTATNGVWNVSFNLEEF